MAQRMREMSQEPAVTCEYYLAPPHLGIWLNHHAAQLRNWSSGDNTNSNLIGLL